MTEVYEHSDSGNGSSTLSTLLAGVNASLRRSYKRHRDRIDLTQTERIDLVLFSYQAAHERLEIIRATARFIEENTPDFETALQTAYHNINEAAIDALHYQMYGKQLLQERDKQRR